MSTLRRKAFVTGSILKRCAIIFGTIIAIFFLYLLLVPNVIGDGAIGRMITVTVRDSEGDLVSGASVALLQSVDSSLESVLKKGDLLEQLKLNHRAFLSNEKGTGVLSAIFGAGWHNGLFGRSGEFLISGILTASYPDYLEVRAPLANFTQQREFPISRQNLDFTIYLERKKVSETASESR